MSTRAFSVGDYIRWLVGDKWRSIQVFGIISRVSDLSLTVRPEDGGRAVVVRRKSADRNWPCYYVTPHEMAMERWYRKTPRTDRVRVSWQSHEAVLKIEARLARDQQDVDAIIADLTAVRAWLADRPVAP